MPLPYPRPVPAQIGAVLGDDELIELDVIDGGIARLRPRRPGRAVLALHARPPEQRALAREIERLFWLAGRATAPEVIATGRAEEGDEVVVVRMPVGAMPASRPEHGVDPAGLAAALGAALREVHRLPREEAPLAPSLEQLRKEASHRVSHGLVTNRPDGPYRRRSPERLLATLDNLLAELDAPDAKVIHGSPVLENLWIAPDRSVILTGWSGSGLGDSHRDLAVASRSLGEGFGPAVVAPFLDAYGLDEVDLRRLDAHQLLDHLLT
jgi:aminoglycoside 3'-phosphotransferase-2